MEVSDDAVEQGDYFDSSRKADPEPTSNYSPPGEEEQRPHNIPAMDCDDDSRKRKIAVKSGDEDDDGFVALDIARLVAAATTVEHVFPAAAAATASPGTPVAMKKSLSRKLSLGGGPHRGGGEAGRLHAVGGTNGRDVPPLSPHVAPDGEAASVAGGGRYRRPSAGRRPSPWRDPRRVLFVFASLSCMGTLILLYLALSMGRLTSTDVDADS